MAPANPPDREDTSAQNHTSRVHPGLLMIALTILSLALLPVRLGTLMGLPAHPFLIHVPVVFIPLTVLCAVILVTRATLWERYVLPLSALATFTLAVSILAVGAGKVLRAQLFPNTTAALASQPDLVRSRRFQGIMGNQQNLVSEHAHAGDLLLYGMIALALVLAVCATASVVLRGRALGIRSLDRLLTSKASIATLRSAVLLLSLFCGFMVYRTGHLGAKLVWADRIGMHSRGPGAFGGGAAGQSTPLFGEPSGGSSTGGGGPQTQHPEPPPGY